MMDKIVRGDRFEERILHEDVDWMNAPHFSVIVPVYGRPQLLAACLKSIRASSFSSYELLLADDGSPDPEPIRALAERFGARLVRSGLRRGSAAARNRAAEMARGETLVFVDADVTINADVLDRLAQTMDQETNVDAVIGSYDSAPAGHSMTSHFRNLLHSHAHQRSPREAQTFWTGLGAIRASRFRQLGGFKEEFERPSIEDVELGLRLRQAGGRIVLDSRIQGTHHKDWTLREMVRTDLTARAIPWAALIREHGLPRGLNFRWADRAAAALSAALIPISIVAARHGAPYWAAAAAVVIAIAVLQRSILQFLGASRGIFFAIRCLPLLLLYNITCVTGLAAGLIRAEHRRDPWWIRTVLASACLIAALQLAGGAFHAEFDGMPDEAGHFVSALLISDYVNTLPPHPIDWAEQYYVHYPKVAIGHWPPLFYMSEAVWWMLLPPSRVSAMLLNAILLLAAAAIFYGRVRDVAAPWLACSAVLLLLAAPVTQQSAEQAMTESLCLLFSVLLLDSIARLVARPTPSLFALAAFWIACAFFTKYNGVTLAAAPVLALLPDHKLALLFHSRVFRWSALAIGLLTAGVGSWVLFGTGLGRWLAEQGGLHGGLPSSGGDLVHLAGAGVLALACAGALVAIYYRQPAGLAALAILLSVRTAAIFIHAMREPRHFIIVLPALFLLAAAFAERCRRWNGFALLLPAAALILFPFTLYRQQPAGLTDLVGRISLPARMLVSSDSSREGAWIATVALREKRPSSVIARASKLLATSNWNGEYYKLRVSTPQDVLRELDQAGIDTVVLLPAAEVPQHQRLLETAVRDSPAWRASVSTSGGVVYHRIAPPAYARRPLQIDLRDQMGTVITEH